MFFSDRMENSQNRRTYVPAAAPRRAAEARQPAALQRDFHDDLRALFLGAHFQSCAASTTTRGMSAPIEANGHAAPAALVAAAEPTKPPEAGPEPIADAAAAAQTATRVNGEATAAAARDADAPDAALIAALSEGRRTRGSMRAERTPSPAEQPEPEAKAEAPEPQAVGDGEAPPALECPEIPRMLEPSHASQLSLVGRNIDVLWPDDGSWWKARVVNLNPHNGMATLYYEPNAKVMEEDEPETKKEAEPFVSIEL